MNEEMNVRGSIDLLKLENAYVITVTGKTGTKKRGVFIPVEENDLYVTIDESLKKAKAAYLGLLVNKRREKSQYGKTHYAKQSLSNDFRNNFKELAEKKNGVYLGDFETYTIESGNAAGKVEAQQVDVAPEEQDDLPF